jgi:CO/xanthine dehydrogenase Mo-binding subunit
VSKALAVPGVVTVLTAADVPCNLFGVMIADWPVLAADVVRQVGDPIALVAAVSLAAAAAGALAVEVDIEPLPAVSSPEAALEPGSPVLHEGGNLVAELRYEKGDVEAALLSAAVVIDRIVHTPCQEHVCLEPGGGVAIFDNGRFTIWCGTQDPGIQCQQVALALQVRPEVVRIISTPMGGAFGSKLDGALPTHLALLAKATGRPVKIVLSREEVMLVGSKRHPYTIHTRLGLDGLGRIVALDTDALVDTGPYASHGPAVFKVSAELSTGAYRIPAARFHGRLVYTNNANAGAFRGYGAPQVSFAIESAIDAAALRLGIDPAEIRRRNVLKPGDEQGLYGHRVSASLRAGEVLEAVAAHPWWQERGYWQESGRGPWRRGTGIAFAIKGVGMGSGRGDKASASLTILEDGRVQIWAGPNHSGQSIETTYAQIAAETLGRDVEDVDVFVGDSGLVPESGSCSASRSTYSGGSAVHLVCLQLLDEIAGPLPEDAESWRKVGRRLRTSGKATLNATFFAPDVEDLGSFEGELEKFSPHAVYGSSGQVARVEVNELTGEARVVAVACAIDCGTAINPAGIVGQAQGGIAQGVGFALMEGYRLTDAVPQTKSLETYLIPTALDVPDTDIVLIESSEESGPFGAKGIAEVVLVPTAPAIVAAIRDATGLDLRALPASPESVIRGMRGY